MANIKHIYGGLVALLLGTILFSPVKANATKQQNLDYVMGETIKTGSIESDPTQQKEQINLKNLFYVIKEAQKTKASKTLPNGLKVKWLHNQETTHNEETNVYFSIASFGKIVKELSINIHYRTFVDNIRITKQLIIKDLSPPDCKPAEVYEIIASHEEVTFNYEDKKGSTKLGKIMSMTGWYSKKIDLRNHSEEKRISEIYGKIVKLFKLKIEMDLPGSDKNIGNLEYNTLKQDVRELIMQSEHLNKSLETLSKEKEQTQQLIIPKIGPRYSI